VTNNSTRSREDNHQKLVKMGIPGDLEDMFGSSYSAAIYINRIVKLPAGKNKVFVVGESGIEKELASEGIPYIGGTDPAYQREFTPAEVPSIADGSALDSEVGVVLCGLDFHISYLKLAHALQYLRRGALFLATNTDSTFTMSHAFFPAASSSSAPLTAALKGVKPLVLGKPSQTMMDAVETKFQLDRSRTCMVGDSLDTDIRFGTEGGLGGTLHVLSGVSSKEDWQKEGAPVVPTQRKIGCLDRRLHSLSLVETKALYITSILLSCGFISHFCRTQKDDALASSRTLQLSGFFSVFGYSIPLRTLQPSMALRAHQPHNSTAPSRRPGACAPRKSPCTA
jgi:4-nitrophenyl phosphatase